MQKVTWVSFTAGRLKDGWQIEIVENSKDSTIEEESIKITLSEIHNCPDYVEGEIVWMGKNYEVAVMLVNTKHGTTVFVADQFQNMVEYPVKYSGE